MYAYYLMLQNYEIEINFNQIWRRKRKRKKLSEKNYENSTCIYWSLKRWCL